jgi:AhpC/TSA family
MRKRLSNALTASLLTSVLIAAAFTASAAQTANGSPAMPKVGDAAPDFKLSYIDGNDEKEITLSQYRGKKNVVLAFYVFAFTGG